MTIIWVHDSLLVLVTQSPSSKRKFTRMELEVKQTLLTAIIEAAKTFTLNMKRRRMLSVDIQSAIHSLGLQPLLCDRESNGDDAVIVSDFVPSMRQIPQEELDVRILPGTVWRLSTTNYRRRKYTVGSSRANAPIPKKLLSEINSMNLISIHCRSDSQIVFYFTGIHFSDTVCSESGVHWKFVRGGINMVNRSLSLGWSRAVFTPWIDGLGRVGDNGVDLLEIESPEQQEKIRNVCSNLTQKLA
jgi:hypothetical protein